MSQSTQRPLLDGEERIFEGRPDWRAWAGLTILGVVLVPVLVGIVILVVVAMRKRSFAWLVTNRRIETERGFVSRRIDTLELWRVADVEFRQGLWDRLFGVATIVVISHDEEAPQLELRGLPGDRALYDRLMNAVIVARQQRQVLSVVT
jgi:membrane protein YdbS with pleckstrin-like domain